MKAKDLLFGIDLGGASIHGRLDPNVSPLGLFLESTPSVGLSLRSKHCCHSLWGHHVLCYYCDLAIRPALLLLAIIGLSS